MNLNNEHKVLDHGFVRLDGYMADDLSVVNAARVSFAQRQDEMDARSEGLIAFLMRERHGTPFEHNAMRFHVKAPLFVVREWQRHRIASYNEWSGRYSVIHPEFYMPTLKDVRTQVGKPGSYTFESMEYDDAHWTQVHLEKMYKTTYNHYESMLERGVAKEVARLVLPLATYTQFYFTVNARSLMNYLSLRNSEQAQREIKEYAIILEKIWGELMPVTHSTFIQNGRVAP